MIIVKNNQDFTESIDNNLVFFLFTLDSYVIKILWEW